MKDIEEEFPSLVEARAAIGQGAYEQGLEIYSELLDGISQEDMAFPYISLEYADALIKNCDAYFTKEIKKVSGRQGFDLAERNEIEEDLETAWYVLETCRTAFIVLRDYPNLITTRRLLGEVCLLNNEFLDAVHEFTECLVDMEAVLDNDDIKFAEIYRLFAISYGFLEKYDMAEEYYNKAIAIYRNAQEKAQTEEEKDSLAALISDLLYYIGGLEYKKNKADEELLPEEPESDDDGVVIDLNACKRDKR